MNPVIKALLMWFFAHASDLPAAIPLLKDLFNSIRSGDPVAIRLAVSNLLAFVSQEIATGKKYGATVPDHDTIAEKLSAAGCDVETQEDVMRALKADLTGG